MSTGPQPDDDRERDAELERASVAGRLEEIRKERSFLQDRVTELNMQEQKYVRDLGLLNDNEEVMGI